MQNQWAGTEGVGSHGSGAVVTRRMPRLEATRRIVLEQAEEIARLNDTARVELQVLGAKQGLHKEEVRRRGVARPHKVLTAAGVANGKTMRGAAAR